MQKTTELIVVVPCYNEENRLNLEAFLKFAENYNNILFQFVDDGSSDNTSGRISEAIADNTQFDCLTLERNGGKAEAVRQGLLKYADSEVEYLAFWDADLATPLESIPEMLEYMKTHEGLEALLASRVMLLGKNIKRKAKRHYLGRIFATFASLSINCPVYDTQCGAKLFRNSKVVQNAFSAPFYSRWIFDVEFISRILCYGGARAGECKISDLIHEFPLDSWEDIEGSKLKGSDFIRAIFELVIIGINHRKGYESQV